MLIRNWTSKTGEQSHEPTYGVVQSVATLCFPCYKELYVHLNFFTSLLLELTQHSSIVELVSTNNPIIHFNSSHMTRVCKNGSFITLVRINYLVLLDNLKICRWLYDAKHACSYLQD